MVCFLWSCFALAQLRQPDPFSAAMSAYWDARNHGRFEEASARREEARSLLARTAVDAPLFGAWVQGLAQLYENGGLNAQARAIVEEALSRVEGLGESHPTRIMLLGTMASLWQEDRNLLKALAYREKAVAALEAAPQAQSPALSGVAPGPGAQVRVLAARGVRAGVPDSALACQRLADLYQRLGRQEAAVAVLVKMRKLAKDNDAALASMYERQGKLDEAAALYKKQAEQAAANPQAQPWQRVAPLESLASLYQREQRYAEAAAAMEQAIAGLEATGKPEARNQTLWMRQRLADILHQAGQTEASDGIFRQLLSEARDGDGAHRQLLMSFANYLGRTNRSAQGEQLLRDYLASHSNLQPGEESNLLFHLADLARQSGDTKRAGEYQRRATERQQAAQPAPSGDVFIVKDLQKAQTAAGGGNLDEAFHLALEAIDAAPRAPDREQITWQAANIAEALANQKAAHLADQLYQRLFALVRSWSADTIQPLSQVSQHYVRFLMRHDRRDEAPDAIERYRDVLLTARGTGTGWLEEVLRLSIEVEGSRGSSGSALRAAQDLLALEESLSGTTSEPYLRAVETLAGVYESSGDGERVTPLRRQAVAIADVISPANDPRRGFVRMNAAFGLARLRQFEEAERLAEEAVSIGQRLRPPQPNMFAGQLEQIRRMRAAPQPGVRGPDGAVRSLQWFDATRPNAATVAPAAGTATDKKPEK